MIDIFFKLIGAVGLILVSIGIITKKRERQDMFYIFGGICLEIYSIYLVDYVFIVLQIIFTLSALYDLCRLRTRKG